MKEALFISPYRLHDCNNLCKSSNKQTNPLASFACELKVEWAESYPECLENGERVCDVHVEVLFPYAPELHVYSVVVELVD